MYNKRFEEAKKTASEKATDYDIYLSLTGTKAGPDGIIPAESLLREANFWAAKDTKTDHILGSKYSYVRQVVLKSTKMWEIFEELMLDYQNAALPHPKLQECIEDLEQICSRAGSEVQTHVLRRCLTTHKYVAIICELVLVLSLLSKNRLTGTLFAACQSTT